jgi:hypothetical protein
VLESAYEVGNGDTIFKAIAKPFAMVVSTLQLLFSDRLLYIAFLFTYNAAFVCYTTLLLTTSTFNHNPILFTLGALQFSVV